MLTLSCYTLMLTLSCYTPMLTLPLPQDPARNRHLLEPTWRVSVRWTPSPRWPPQPDPRRAMWLWCLSTRQTTTGPDPPPLAPPSWQLHWLVRIGGTLGVVTFTITLLLSLVTTRTRRTDLPLDLVQTITRFQEEILNIVETDHFYFKS